MAARKLSVIAARATSLMVTSYAWQILPTSARDTCVDAYRRRSVTGPRRGNGWESRRPLAIWSAPSATRMTSDPTDAVASTAERINRTGLSVNSKRRFFCGAVGLAPSMSEENESTVPSSDRYDNNCAAAMPSAMQWWIFIRIAHRSDGSPSMIQHSHSGRDLSSRRSMMSATTPNRAVSSPGCGTAVRRT